MKHEKGQLLIEAAIAISILTIGIFGMINLLNRSLGLNVVVTSQYVGSNLAMEGVEVVKNLIDSNVLKNEGMLTAWNDGLTAGDYQVEYSSTQLMPYQDTNLWFDQNTGFYSYSSAGKQTNFKRKITITNTGNPDEIQVNSIVSWKIKGGNHEINVEDHFFNWRKANPTP